MVSARSASPSDSRLSVAPAAIAASSSPLRLPGPAKLIAAARFDRQRLRQLARGGHVQPVDQRRHGLEQGWQRIGLDRIMQVDLRKRRPKPRYACLDSRWVVHENRCPRLRRPVVGGAPADAQRAGLRRELRRQRAHRLHDVTSARMAARSSLPLALRGRGIAPKVAARLHECGQLPAQPGTQRLLARRVARDHRDDALPDPLVRHTDRHRLPHLAARGDRVLDLAGTDAVPRGLDHLIVAPDEAEQAVRALDHGVAGPHGGPARHGPHGWRDGSAALFAPDRANSLARPAARHGPARPPRPARRGCRRRGPPLPRRTGSPARSHRDGRRSTPDRGRSSGTPRSARTSRRGRPPGTARAIPAPAAA